MATSEKTRIVLNCMTDHNPANNKTPGKFKDECGGSDKQTMQIMTEFIGLKAKVYSYKAVDYKSQKDSIECRKLKAISKITLKKQINFDNYKTALLDGKVQKHTVYSIRSMKQTNS